MIPFFIVFREFNNFLALTASGNYLKSLLKQNPTVVCGHRYFYTDIVRSNTIIVHATVLRGKFLYLRYSYNPIRLAITDNENAIRDSEMAACGCIP